MYTSGGGGVFVVAYAMFMVVVVVVAAWLAVSVDAQRIGTKEYYDKDGPYTCSSRPETVTVPHDSDYKQQSRSTGAKLWVPEGEGPFPVLSYAHGIGAQPTQYSRSIVRYCTWGIIVIGSTTGGVSPVGGASYGDIQNHGLAYVAKRGQTPGDSLYGKVVERFAVSGHSLGGGSTVVAARSWPEKLSVGIPLHPAPFVYGAPREGSVPLIYLTGSGDYITAANLIKRNLYDRGTEPRIFGNLRGAGHLEPMDFGGQRRHDPYVVAALRLYLHDEIEAAQTVWGTGEGSLKADGRFSVEIETEGNE